MSKPASPALNTPPSDPQAVVALLALPIELLDQALAAAAERPALPQLQTGQRRALHAALPHDPVPVAQAQVQALAHPASQIVRDGAPAGLPPLPGQLAAHEALGALAVTARDLGEAALTSVALLDDAAEALERRLLALLQRQIASDLPVAEKRRWLDRFTPLLRLRPEAEPGRQSPLLARLAIEAAGGRAAILFTALHDRLRQGEPLPDEDLRSIASALTTRPPPHDGEEEGPPRG